MQSIPLSVNGFTKVLQLARGKLLARLVVACTYLPLLSAMKRWYRDALVAGFGLYSKSVIAHWMNSHQLLDLSFIMPYPLLLLRLKARENLAWAVEF